MSTAIFLGAGASKEFGYPVTANLLPRIIARYRDDILFRGSNSHAANRRDRKWFGRRLYDFLPGLADTIGRKEPANLNLGVSVTDLLTLVDRALFHAEARAGMPPEDLGRFRQLLDRSVYESLLHGNARRTKPATLALDQFEQWVKDQSSVAILTTNYDTALDLRLFRDVSGDNLPQSSQPVADGVDFGFSWRRVSSARLVPRPRDPRWRLFKLHGSVNWLRCALCGQIYINTRQAVGAKSFATRLSKWNTCHCNAWARLRLHLVTPSFVRQTNDAQLLGIWQAALESLRTADHWFIIGYSLPAEDIAIRSLFLRAWDGHKRKSKPKVTVVQLDDPATESRYRTFFRKRNLTYLRDGLSKFLMHSMPGN